MNFHIQADVAARGFNVSLSVGAGETVAVLGPNGAGKSTLLSVIAGLLRPDSGLAQIDDRVLFDLSGGSAVWTQPHERGTVLLAQEPLLFPHLTSLDNVGFGPRSGGMSRSAAREAGRHWLTEVDIAELAHRRPAQLSGGQAQRVAVARALAASPDLLLLDEPMAALDIDSAPLLRRVLKRVLAGRRAIIVTHDILDALMLADRIVVMDKGHIIEVGPTREILERPRSNFAAGLAGLNLITGIIVGGGVLAARDDGGANVGARDVGGGVLAARDDGGANVGGASGARAVGNVFGRLDPAATPGQEGIAVFLPSGVSVFLEPAHGSPRNCFRVSITDLEPQGGQIRVRAGGLSADVTASAAADLGLEPGLEVYFVVKAAAVSIYPADAGQPA